MSIEAIYTGLFWLCLYMAPLAIIAGSKRTWGNEKTGWLFCTILFSWLALIAYYSTALNKKDREARHRAKMKYQQQAEAAAARQQARQRLEAQVLANQQQALDTDNPDEEINEIPLTEEQMAQDTKQRDQDRGEV